MTNKEKLAVLAILDVVLFKLSEKKVDMATVELISVAKILIAPNYESTKRYAIEEGRVEALEVRARIENK